MTQVKVDVSFVVDNIKIDTIIHNQGFSADVAFDEDDNVFADFGVINEVVVGDTYDGDYEVTPRAEEQVLPTAKKIMVDDVTITKIPYYETSNLSDGETVYIGMEVDIYGN